MSRQRRNFSAKFKSDLVIELLKGEKDLNTLATENNIQPNLLRNWKKEFLNNASAAFDDKREENLKDKLAEERKEKSEYAKKVGQLTMQVDWLKKNLKKFVDLTTRVSLVQNLLTTKELPASVGAKLLDINRTSIYYKGTPVSEEELACKEIIDHLHTDNPTWGARQMSAQLKLRGYHVGRRKARRYMSEMDIHPIYPKMNLSKRMQQAKVFPYLLRNAVIDKPNQAWSIDITYIPIRHGFLYLTAVIDWYSRCIVGWEVDDTLDTRMVVNALKKAFKVAKPQILNSDQGCQFTSQQYISELINHNEEVNIRMFYSTFEEDQYISILNEQDQEVSFNFVNDSIEIELIDPLCEKILITFDTVEQTAKVHRVFKFLLDLFFKFNWHESIAALSVADFWELIKNYENDNLDMTFGYPRIAGSNS